MADRILPIEFTLGAIEALVGRAAEEDDVSSLASLEKAIQRLAWPACAVTPDSAYDIYGGISGLFVECKQWPVALRIRADEGYEEFLWWEAMLYIGYRRLYEDEFWLVYFRCTEATVTLDVYEGVGDKERVAELFVAAYLMCEDAGRGGLRRLYEWLSNELGCEGCRVALQMIDTLIAIRESVDGCRGG